MKFLLPLVFSMITASFSQNAFAIHAYRSEVCKSETLSLVYKGNYPVGGMYGVSLLMSSNEEDTTALPLDDGEYQSTLEDASFIFNEISSVKITDKPIENDCYFDHEEYTSQKVLEVSLISEVAAKKLGVKQGDKILFTCEETFDFPNGNTCEEKED